MQNKIVDYIKSEIRELLLAVIVLVCVVFGFAAYLKFVGLPMTRARNTYNAGMLIWAAGDSTRAKQYFIDSLGYWRTAEAQEALEKAQGQQGKDN